MEIQDQTLYTPIAKLCVQLEQEFNLIPEERKALLLELTNYLQQKYETKTTPQVNVICTHNSRRSHLGQLWLAVGASYYNVQPLGTYSGGTEATALNPRVVTALRQLGFAIQTDSPDSNNPVYKVQWQQNDIPYNAFSKCYDQAPNPSSNYAAVLVCTEANEACPVVTGCDFRLALPYEDPKAFDDTALEAEKYIERSLQIGREMLFVLSKL